MLDFYSRESKSIRGSSYSTRTKIGKKCPPFGLAVQADLFLRRIEEYFGTPRSSEGTTPSITANALRKDLRRAYLVEQPFSMDTYYESTEVVQEIFVDDEILDENWDDKVDVEEQFC